MIKWVNVYPSYGDAREIGPNLFTTKEQAVTFAHEGVIATIQIEWEES